MAWTAPRTWVVGEIVTKAIMDVHVRDNLLYLKTETDLYDVHAVATTGVHGVGARYIAETTTENIDFADHESRHLYNGSDRLSMAHREVVINWESNVAALAVSQVTVTTNGGGSVEPGGTGQVVLKTDDDIVGDARIDQQTEQNSSLDNTWPVTKNPYFRVEFGVNNNDTVQDIFIGLRQTPGAAIPAAAAENFTGLVMNVTNWNFMCGDGAGGSQQTAATVSNNARHVLEMVITSATSVVYTLDGGTPVTHSTDLPTGDLEWCLLLDSAAGGGAGDDSFLTIGKLVLRSAL